MDLRCLLLAQCLVNRKDHTRYIEKDRCSDKPQLGPERNVHESAQFLLLYHSLRVVKFVDLRQEDYYTNHRLVHYCPDRYERLFVWPLYAYIGQVASLQHQYHPSIKPELTCSTDNQAYYEPVCR